jgi:hypothetical protein
MIMSEEPINRNPLLKSSVPHNGKESQTPIHGGVRCLNAIEKAWLAGVIDGDGSIFISKITGGNAVSKYRRGFAYVAMLSLDSANEAFPKKVLQVIGKGSVNFVEEKRLNWKDRWCYRGNGLVLRGLLPQLLPQLLIKREVSERMLEYLAFIDANPIDGPMKIPQGHHEKQDFLYSAVKLANEKGRDVSPELLNVLLSQPKGLRNRRQGERSTDCRELTEEEKAWLAGAIDGEGSIFLSKVRNPASRRGFFYRPQIGVSNSNRAFLVRAMKIIGEGTVQLAKKGDSGWKTRWVYGASAGFLRAVLPQIMPYLIVKRLMAEKMLEYFEYIDGENSIQGKKEVPAAYYETLDSLYLAMKKLNEKGKPSSLRAEG